MMKNNDFSSHFVAKKSMSVLRIVNTEAPAKKESQQLSPILVAFIGRAHRFGKRKQEGHHCHDQ